MEHEQNKIVNIGDVVRPVPPVRDHFDEQELQRLATSIRENGILVPLLCRPKDGKYEVIDGDRRLAAAWKAELREVPIMVRNLNDEQTHIQRMLANLDRHDPDPVSEAKYIAEVVGNKVFTIEEFATKLGRTIDWVEGRLTIAEMPPYMKDALSEAKISLGVCMELHKIKDTATKERYFREAMQSGMTIHAAKVSTLIVNEAIEALERQELPVTEESVPRVQTIPNVRCAYTGEVLPVTATRSVRVGIENHRKWQQELREQPAPVSEE